MDSNMNVVFTHDCSTLGGNSGSPIINTNTGSVVGLHFSGRYESANFAVRGSVITSRIADILPDTVAVQGSYSHAPLEVEESHDALESKREPDFYSDRKGYDEGFLGKKHKAPLPKLTGDLQADAAPVDGGGNELKYCHFSVIMSKSRRIAYYAACNIDGKKLFRFPRKNDRWFTDSRIADEHQVDNALYSRNDLDRGHLVRRLDPVWGDEDEARLAMEDTFHYTNAAPQHKYLNQRIWLDLENYILDNTEANDYRISVLTGPVFGDNDQVYRGIGLPKEFWKIVTMVVKKNGSKRTSSTAYLLSQANMLDSLELPSVSIKPIKPVSRILPRERNSTSAI